MRSNIQIRLPLGKKVRPFYRLNATVLEYLRSAPRGLLDMIRIQYCLSLEHE
jgi:hypothetical protein